MHALYFASLIALSLFGVFEILSELGDHEKCLRICKPCSIGLEATAILLFAISRQAYLTTFLFLLFLVKIVLLLAENRIYE